MLLSTLTLVAFLASPLLIGVLRLCRTSDVAEASLLKEHFAVALPLHGL